MIELTGFETVQDLITLRRKLQQQQTSATLTKTALAQFLRRCLQGELSISQLISIANELEANDEIDYEQGVESVIATILFEIATPEVNRQPTPKRCSELIASLTGKSCL